MLLLSKTCFYSFLILSLLEKKWYYGQKKGIKIMLLSLIVPCYNEQDALPLFYRETVSVLKNMDCDYELILVNDGSKDKTLTVMKELAAADPSVFYYSFSRNFGKEAAMYAGFCNARGDYVAVMDADLQDPPSLLPEMVRILESGEYDSVATRRADRAGEPPVRSWFARRFYSLINKISDADIVDGARDFRLMTRDMKDAILSMSEYNRFSKGIFSWVGFRVKYMPYKNVERPAGTTSWSFWGLFRYSLEGIMAFSTAPLALAILFGILGCAASLILYICAIISACNYGDGAGTLAIIGTILLVGGLDMICTGVLGQYLGKTYMESKHRPIYIASETDETYRSKKQGA